MRRMASLSAHWWNAFYMKGPEEFSAPVKTEGVVGMAALQLVAKMRWRLGTHCVRNRQEETRSLWNRGTFLTMLRITKFQLSKGASSAKSGSWENPPLLIEQDTAGCRAES